MDHPVSDVHVAATLEAHLLLSPDFREVPGDPPSPELRVYLPTVEGQSATSLPPPSALAWLTGKCDLPLRRGARKKRAEVDDSTRAVHLSTQLNAQLRDPRQAFASPVPIPRLVQ